MTNPSEAALRAATRAMAAFENRPVGVDGFARIIDEEAAACPYAVHTKAGCPYCEAIDSREAEIKRLRAALSALEGK